MNDRLGESIGVLLETEDKTPVAAPSHGPGSQAVQKKRDEQQH